MSGFDQWCRFLGWQTQALMEREGYDLGPLPKAAAPTPPRRRALSVAIRRRSASRRNNRPAA